jgi:hypothetical protein
MKGLYLLIFSVLFSFIAFGQNREKEFYSYLQHKLSNDLGTNDSLIIDQFSDKEETYNWQAVIKVEADSCIVTFLPPQYSQDTMVLPGELIPINVFITSKAGLVNAFEQAKNNLKKDKNKSGVLVEISVTYRNKTQQYKLRKVKELYYRRRYNQSSY